MLGKPILRETTETGMDLVMWDHETDNGYTIMTYPIAANYGKYFVNRGERFCCPLTRIPEGREMEIWDGLIKGKITLRDCIDYFHEPVKHTYYLGY